MKAVLLICILGAALVLPALAEDQVVKNKEKFPSFYIPLKNTDDNVLKILFGGMTPEEIEAWKEKQQQQNNGPPC